MKQFVFFVCAIATVGNMIAAPATGEKKVDPRKMSAEERKAYNDYMRYTRTGGEIVRPGTIHGKIAIVDCRAEAARTDISAAVSALRKTTHIAIVEERGAFDIAAPKHSGGATLFVVDDSKYPMSLVALESRWALVNAAPLKEGRGEKSAFFNARMEKELARIFSVLCGGMGSNFNLPLTAGVFSPKDLDKIVSAQLPPDVVCRYANYLAPIGIIPGQFVSYRLACQQGWAPAPTNDIQRAIWDQVHAIPKNPMKIEFDPKKGR